LNKTRELVEASLFAALLVVMMIGSYYIPILGSILYIILPLPMIVYASRGSLLYATLSGIVAIVLSGLMVTFIYSLTAGAMAVAVGIPIGYSIKHLDAPHKSILYGAIGAFAALILSIAIGQFVLGVSIYDEIDLMFGDPTEIRSQLEMFSGEDATPEMEAAIAETEKIWAQVAQITKLIFPTLLIIMSFAYSWINFGFSRLVFKRLRIPQSKMAPFSEFFYPKKVAYGGAGMIFGAYLIGMSGIVDYDLVVTNFLYLFVVVFSVQGFSFMYYYMKEKMPKSVAIIMMVLAGMLGLLQLIGFMGFFDCLFNFRKLESKTR